MRLRVTDPSGSTDTEQTELTVGTPPTATIAAPGDELDLSRSATRSLLRLGDARRRLASSGDAAACGRSTSTTARRSSPTNCHVHHMPGLRRRRLGLVHLPRPRVPVVRHADPDRDRRRRACAGKTSVRIDPKTVELTFDSVPVRPDRRASAARRRRRRSRARSRRARRSASPRRRASSWTASPTTSPPGRTAAQPRTSSPRPRPRRPTPRPTRETVVPDPRRPRRRVGLRRGLGRRRLRHLGPGNTGTISGAARDRRRPLRRRAELRRRQRPRRPSPDSNSLDLRRRA